jgi:hypothetical protein
MVVESGERFGWQVSIVSVKVPIVVQVEESCSDSDNAPPPDDIGEYWFDKCANWNEKIG